MRVRVLPILFLFACSAATSADEKEADREASQNDDEQSVVPVTFALGGAIAGLVEPGLSLSNGTETLTIAANATTFGFAARVTEASMFAVTITTSPPHSTCTLANAQGTATGDVNVTVTCIYQPAMLVSTDPQEGAVVTAPITDAVFVFDRAMDTGFAGTWSDDGMTLAVPLGALSNGPRQVSLAGLRDANGQTTSFDPLDFSACIDSAPIPALGYTPASNDPGLLPWLEPSLLLPGTPTSGRFVIETLTHGTLTYELDQLTVDGNTLRLRKLLPDDESFSITSKDVKVAGCTRVEDTTWTFDIGALTGVGQDPLNRTTINGFDTPDSVSQWVKLGDALFLVENDPTFGCDLFVLPPGATTVHSLFRATRPGAAATCPSSLTALDNFVAFVADDGTTGPEPYVTDGTVNGTVRMGDIAPGSSGSSARDFTQVDARVYFVATDQVHGEELFVWEGGVATLVSDISSLASSSPMYLTAVNGSLYFAAYSPTFGLELWRSQSATDASLVVDLRAGALGSSPTQLVADADGRVLFAASNTDSIGTEPWIAHDTFGVSLLRNIADLSFESSNPQNFFVAGYSAYFSALGPSDNYFGRELYRTNFTSPGTVMVSDIAPGVADSSPTGFYADGSRIFFSAMTPALGRELWTSDGTSPGTVIVSDYTPGAGSSNPIVIGPVGDGFAVLYDTYDNLVYFPRTGPLQYRTDHLSDALRPISVDGYIYMLRADMGTNHLLWRMNSALEVARFQPTLNRTRPLNPSELISAPPYLYFAAAGADGDRELWRKDAAGASQMIDVWGGGSSSPEHLAALGDEVFFSADGPAGRRLWKSSGGTATLAADLEAPADLRIVGDKLYFTAGVGSRSLYMMTASTAPITVAGAPANPSLLAATTEALYFVADDGAHGSELWRADDSGTALVKDINSTGASAPSMLIGAGSFLYFVADDGEHGSELWRTDGSDTGTVRVTDAGFGDASHACTDGTSVYFAHDDGVTGSELWRVSGTTVELMQDIEPGPQGSSPQGCVPILGEAFVSANDKLVLTHSKSLDVNDPHAFVHAGDTIYFIATDPNAGSRLYNVGVE